MSSQYIGQLIALRICCAGQSSGRTEGFSIGLKAVCLRLHRCNWAASSYFIEAA